MHARDSYFKQVVAGEAGALGDPALAVAVREAAQGGERGARRSRPRGIHRRRRAGEAETILVQSRPYDFIELTNRGAPLPVPAR